MRHRKHYKRVTEAEFNYIKSLEEGGYSTKKIMEKTGRSHSMLDKVKKATSLIDYLQMGSDYRERKNNPLSVPFSNNLPKYNIELKLAKLDSLFEELKTSIVEVAEALAQERVEEFRKEKEEEVRDMKEVIEAAKQSSIAGMLKSKFKKDW